MQGIQNLTMAKSVYRHHYEEIRAKASLLGSVSFLHTRRGANVPAHQLARLGMVTNESCIWYSVVPPSISSAIAADFES